MRRREFITLLGGVAVGCPCAARAQQGAKVPRIGVLWHAASAEEEGVRFDALRKGLADLGYVEGQNINLIDTFAAEQYDLFNDNAVELTKLRVDVLVAVTTPAAKAAQRATTTIPIIFLVVPDPVGSNLIRTLARPGGNITGLSTVAVDLSGKRLELLKELTGLSVVGLLVNANDLEISNRTAESYQASANVLNVNIKKIEVREPADLELAFDQLAREHVGAALQPPDAMFLNQRKRIAELAIAHRIAMLGSVRDYSESGYMMSYGQNSVDSFRHVATYIDKILKGAKPGDLPVEQPTKFELVINLKTVKALGLTVPPSLLARADEVIE